MYRTFTGKKNLTETDPQETNIGLAIQRCEINYLKYAKELKKNP